METLLYLGKVTLTSGILFLYYRIFLKDKTFHHYNRFYLLSAILVSLLLPLLKISYFTIELTPDFYKIINQLDTQNLKTTNHDNTYFKIFIIAFGLVAVFLLGKLVFGLLKIQRFKKNFPKEQFEGINFYQTNLSNAPFSYFKNLFWKDSIILQSDLGKQILKHEMVHIEQKHSFDKIFVEIITSIFWFNPFFYLIKKEIHLIHEYLADKKAVKQSDTKAFAQMLLASHFSGNSLPATSPFLSSNLKKRLKMLKTPKTKFSYARRIFALPLLFAVAFAYLINAKNKEIKTTNQEIAQQVSDLKKDTITPNSFEEIQTKIEEKRMELEPASDELKKKDEEMRKLSEKMTEKGKELNKLSDKKEYDSPKFEKLQQEMTVLGDQMDKIHNSPEYQEKWKKLENHFKDLDGLYAKLDDFYNSDDFKLKIKDAENLALEAEKKVNSPEFKKMIKSAEKSAERVEKMVNSPEFKKMIKRAEKKAEKAEKMVNSPEFKKKIEDAEKRAEEAVKMVNSQEFKMRIEDAKKSESNVIVMSGDSPKQLYINSKDFTNSDISDNAQIYINGKLSTREELNKLNPNTVKTVNINKNNNNGKTTNVIKIRTK